MAYVNNQKFITKCFEGTEQEFEIKFRRMTAAESVQENRARANALHEVETTGSEELFIEHAIEFLKNQVVELRGFYIQEDVNSEPIPVTLLGATEAERDQFFRVQRQDPDVLGYMFNCYFTHLANEMEARKKK